MVRQFAFMRKCIGIVMRLIEKLVFAQPGLNNAKMDASTSCALYRVFNNGNSTLAPLFNYFETLDQGFALLVYKQMKAIQPSDLTVTAGITSTSEIRLNLKPNTQFIDAALGV